MCWGLGRLRHSMRTEYREARILDTAATGALARRSPNVCEQAETID